MYFDDFDTEEVFANFAKIMQDEGHLDKKASYVAPRNLLGDDDYSEIEINDELKRIAAENGGSKLYDIFTEDVMSGAHPEGSTKIADAPEGLGEVETLEDAQKKIHEVAEKKVKLAAKVLELANELDQEGFTNLAMGLDEKVAEFLGKKAAGPADDLAGYDPLAGVREEMQEGAKGFHEKVKNLERGPSQVKLPAVENEADDGVPEVPQIVDPAQMAKQKEELMHALKGVKPKKVGPQGLVPRDIPQKTQPGQVVHETGVAKPVKEEGWEFTEEDLYSPFGEKKYHPVPILGEDPKKR